jgi:hypothetical protein
MSRPIVEIRYFPIGKETQGPFVITLHVPEKDAASKDFLCRVTSSEVAASHLDAYGTTPSQALRFSLELMAARLATLLSSNLIDELSGEGQLGQGRSGGRGREKGGRERRERRRES